MKRLLAAALLSAFVLALSSCGYTLSRTGSRSGPSAGTNKVSVPLFVNDSFEPLVEKPMTAALQEEIAMDGRWMLTDRDAAEMLVEGRVQRVDLSPLSYDAKERILEYRIKVKTEIKVTNVKFEKVVWKDTIETYADYRVTEDVTKSKIRREDALRKAGKTMAEEFIIKVLDIF